MSISKESLNEDVSLIGRTAERVRPGSGIQSLKGTPKQNPENAAASFEAVGNHSPRGVRMQTALLAGLLSGGLGGCALEGPEGLPPLPNLPAELGEAQNGLSIAQMNPPEPPLVMPVSLQPNGAQFRISQGGRDFPTHDGNSTRFAIDISGGGELAYAPIAGTVRRRSGDCNRDPLPNDCGVVCQNDWGNHVELEGVDGHIYLFAHCSSFDAAAPDGAFIGKGIPVCTIGCTGISTARHLHFDRVRRNGNSYISEGVPQLLTFESGAAQPSIENWNTLETCCGGNVCDAQVGTPQCKTYTTFNRSNLDEASTFARWLRANDNRVTAVRGGFTLDQNNHSALSTIYSQQADVVIDGRAQPTTIAYVMGNSSGTGNRNPFITMGYSYYFNPATSQWNFLNYHSDIHTEKFINFDLWDYARSYLPAPEQNQLTMPQNVSHDQNWSPVWELHSTTFQINGRTLNVYEAVQKNARGNRFAILSENNNYTQWTAL